MNDVWIVDKECSGCKVSDKQGNKVNTKVTSTDAKLNNSGTPLCYNDKDLNNITTEENQAKCYCTTTSTVKSVN